MAVDEPKRMEHPNRFYTLDPAVVSAKGSRAEYRAAGESETEIWRSSQRFSTTMNGVAMVSE